MSTAWIAAPVLAGLVMAFPTSQVMAEVELSAIDSPQETSPYVTGELLVKFTEEAAEAIEQAREAGQLPIVGDETLDVLFEKYGVTAIEHVFPNAQNPEAIRFKFPERAKRTPPGAEVPDLSRTYKLTFNPEKNLMEALLELVVDPNVEYAEPNFIATLQRSEEPVP